MKNIDWEDLIERTLSTMAETALALLPVSAMITDIDWKAILLTSAYAGILAVVKAIAKASV